jgi:hypothetical protein
MGNFPIGKFWIAKFLIGESGATSNTGLALGFCGDSFSASPWGRGNLLYFLLTNIISLKNITFFFFFHVTECISRWIDFVSSVLKNTLFFTQRCWTIIEPPRKNMEIFPQNFCIKFYLLERWILSNYDSSLNWIEERKNHIDFTICYLRWMIHQTHYINQHLDHNRDGYLDN